MIDKILLPGLAKPATNGFNMKELNFLGSHVFKLTYEKGKTIQYGLAGKLKIYDEPDSISIGTGKYSFSQSNTIILKTKYDYDNMFSANFSGSFSSPTYSASIKSSLMYHGNMFQETDSSYTLNWDLQQVYNIERDLDSLQFSDEFKKEISKIKPDDASSVFKDFFERFGTHFLTKCSFGGFMTMETSIKDSLINKLTEKQVSAGISAGYNGIINSGKISVDVAVKNSKFISDNRSSIDINIDVNGGQREDDLSDYFKTIYDLPIPLTENPESLFCCEPISDLIEQAGGSVELKTRMDREIEVYINSGIGEDGIFEPPREKNNSQIYCPTQAGFLLTCMNINDNGNRGYTQSYSHNNQPLKQIRGSSSVHYYTQSDTIVPSSSSIIPIGKNNYYMNKYSSTSGKPKEKTTFWPLSIGNFDDPIPVMSKIGLTQVSKQDGFVYCSIEYDKNGDRGDIEINQDGIKTGASMHYYEGHDTWVQKNSFCFPVRKDIPYTITVGKSSGEPTVTAFFCALNGELGFGNPVEQKQDVVNTADSDGFLIAYLDKANNGDRSQLRVYSNKDNNLLRVKNAIPIAMTSIHYYENSDTIVPKNSVMVPIAKGNFFVCEIKDTAGHANNYIQFIPFVIKKD